MSGSKLWFFVDNARAEEFFAIQSFKGLYDLLTVNPESRKKEKNGFYLTEHLSYHIGEAGDLIVQPAFAVHSVVTEEVNINGELQWSLVTGYEGVDRSMKGQGRKVFNHFAYGFDRVQFVEELSEHGHNYLTRLLKIHDYRKAANECKKANGTSLLSFHTASNTTTHATVLFRAGFDVGLCYRSAPKRKTSAKLAKLNNFWSKQKTKRELVSRLTDITDDELVEWSNLAGVMEDINETAPRKV